MLDMDGPEHASKILKRFIRNYIYLVMNKIEGH